MGLVSEFKEFAVKGNVADMAVGIIIGGAFGKIVTSLVNDVIMPPLGLIIGGVDFSSLKLSLPSLKEGAAAVTVNYGAFIQTVVDFTIVAFAIFMLVRAMNKLRLSTPPTPTQTNQEKLLTEIRDLLKARG